MQCESIRERLPLLIYNELAGDEAQSIRDHLEHCPTCTMAHETMLATQRQLDSWPAITAGDSVADALAGAAGRTLPFAQPTTEPRRTARFVPWMAGAAAGIVLAFSVLAIGANVTHSDGQMTISFGRAEPEASQPNDQPLSPAQIDVLSQLFASQSDRQTAFALDLVDQRFRELEGAQDDRFLALVHTIRAMREEDMQRIEKALTVLAMDSAQQTHQTRQALNDVARQLAMQPSNGSLSNYEYQPKEIVP